MMKRVCPPQLNNLEIHTKL
jgi:hypothetical protein